MLISEIRDEIIDEVGGDSTDTDLQTKIVNFIRAALRRLPNRIKDRTLITISYATLSGGAYSLTLPDNFISERDVWRESSTGKRIQIVRKGTDVFRGLANQSTPGSISYYIVYAKTMEFDKQADLDVVIYIDHFKSVGTIAKAIYYGDYEEDQEKGDRKLKLALSELDKINAHYQAENLPTHVEES